ncbi:hypothetical protein GHT09_007633 [Marmota monax]|uniref:Uncharacterized protein n=1 Tax=Marmota monax TaxID=9995 RepID=A0A834PWV0_MARMO|nr:hypothetical protein GHT09_007633 [Marmota monax]
MNAKQNRQGSLQTREVEVLGGPQERPLPMSCHRRRPAWAFDDPGSQFETGCTLSFWVFTLRMLPPGGECAGAAVFSDPLSESRFCPWQLRVNPDDSEWNGSG